MKDIVLKSLFLIPGLFFVSYIFMILIGCISCFLGCSTNFYECSYCNIGKFVLTAALIVFVIVLAPDIKALLKKQK